MFWIDISRWMISTRCSWISVYLFWRTSRAFEPLPFFCSIVSIAVRSKSCRLPFCNLFTSHSSFIVFWERDITSEHHVSRSISLLLFQTIFTFLLLLAIIVTCVLPFVNNKTGEIDNLSELCWEKSYLCLCAGPGQGSNFCLKQCHCFLATYLSSPESYWSILNLGIFIVGNLPLRCISPSTWENQRRVKQLSSLAYQSTAPYVWINHGEIVRLIFLRGTSASSSLE